MNFLKMLTPSKVAGYILLAAGSYLTYHTKDTSVFIAMCGAVVALFGVKQVANIFSNGKGN